MKKPLSGLLCALAITWLALFAALALAAEPGVQVKVDFVCRSAPASHDLFSMTISIAGKPLAGTLVYPPAGLQELRIDTGRPDWRVKRIEYLDIAAPERLTVIYQEDSRVASRTLKFTERPSRSVLSNLLIVVDTCSSVSGLPPPPPPLLPPPPPPPPPSRDRAGAPCSQALLTEYDRLLGARVVLRQRLRVVGDSATQAVLDVGVDSLDRTATQAASTLQGLGRALDEVYLRPLAGRIEAYVKAGVSTSAKRKYDEGDAAGAVLDGVEASALKDEVRSQQQDRQSLQREWFAKFAYQGAVARDMLRRLAPTSADTTRRLNRQVDDIDLRLNRLRGIADESRCALPTSNLPRDSAYEDARVLLGIHPPLDGTEPAISEEETTLVLQPGFMFTFSSKDAQAAVAYRQARQQLKPITDNDTAAMLWLGSALKAVTSGDIFGGGASVLQQGTVVSATLPRRQAKPVSLVTPEARVTPQGTAYLVHRDARRAMTFVYVTEGSVAISPSRGAALRLAAGQAALVTASGATALVPGGIRVATPPMTGTPSNSPFEPNSNRNGSDYASFDLPQADPQLCLQRCTGDNSCRAWTYVKPGVQGANARCYLKNPVPPATPNNCCVSGAVPRIIDQQVNFEVNTNRHGSDYARFDLTVANPDQCFERCRGDNRCAAWTFVRPGVQGPQAVCYLKSPAPAPTPNNCCVSGAMPGRVTPPIVTPPPPPPPPLIQDPRDRSGDLLGQVWSEVEETELAIWTRRPGSNIFDASWSNGRVRAVLEMTLLGNQVTIRRTRGSDGYDCIYTGTINGNQASGSFGCNRFVGQKGWRATIRSNVGAALPLTAFTQPPQQQPVQTQPRYLGCFKDPNRPFDLDGFLERSDQNTPQRCVQVCAARGFKYAGVQYSESCLCGNSYGRFGSANNCTMACTGDARQICGGGNANSVYSTGQ